MQFNMQLYAVGVRDGQSDKSLNLGSWQAGFDNNLTLLNTEIMKNFTADKVYRVVTVEVNKLISVLRINCQNVLMIFFSKNRSYLKTTQHQRALEDTVSI